MISRIVKKQVQFISINANIDDIYVLDKIRYGLEATYNETFKLLQLLTIAFILDKLSAFLIMFTLLMLIRPHVGGSHSKTLLNCIIKSNVVFVVIYILASMLPNINIFLHLLLILITIYSVNKYKPVNPLRKKVNTSYNYIQFKTIVSITVILWFIISNIFLSDYLTNCGILMILYILLDYLKEVFKHEKTKQI